MDFTISQDRVPTTARFATRPNGGAGMKNLERNSVKKLLVASIIAAAFYGGPAIAADMTVRAPPPPAPISNWTGIYVGANGGYGWRDPPVTYTPNDPAALLGTCGGGTCIPPASFNIGGALVVAKLVIIGNIVRNGWRVSRPISIGPKLRASEIRTLFSSVMDLELLPPLNWSGRSARFGGVWVSYR